MLGFGEVASMFGEVCSMQIWGSRMVSGQHIARIEG